MAGGEALDHAQLVEYLRALAHEVRLDLLEILREPRALGDIRLAPRRVLEGENPERSMSRQAVQEHLDRLLEIGVVLQREGDASGKRARTFVVNQQRLYQILEEFRRVGTVAHGGPFVRDATVDLGGSRPGRMEEGPKLVIVHGLHEGKAFPLHHVDLREGRGWIVGRKPGLHVSLEYDPYVSLENAEIHPEGRAFLIQDLRTSRNGTWLNWERLDKDEPTPLATGAVVGVGRSLLVFRAA